MYNEILNTRVGQFDNEMFEELIKFSNMNPLIEELQNLMNEAFEYEEKQIADSHDITKSNFGFNGILD